MANRFTCINGTDLIGAHISTKGGLPTAFGRARAIHAAAVAIFSKNSSQWKAKPLSEEDCVRFREERALWSATTPVIAHASYLINLATTNEEFHRKSIDGLVDELRRAELLGLSAVVLHPGAHLGAGVEAGLEQIARSLDQVHRAIPDCAVVTLLETAAGQGSCVGCSFEELGRILKLVDDPSRMGVCIDTCHIFSAGYDIRTRTGYEATIDELAEEIGIENLGAFHINDSKKDLGSRVDRHEHIGEGKIGLDAFAFLLNDERFAGIPKMLETPKPTELEADIRNLTLLRSLVGVKTNRA
ncbi:MAG TPA: deoxyribonuclease IV [Thermoanaerobaculia bacterium]|nr:deoxyribonuclease IV [Thermoanaerobaculia bacterium]